MKKIVFTTALFLFVMKGTAEAFIFTDLVAKVQRIVMISQVAKQIEEFNKYKDQFDNYKLQFDKYFTNFRQIYRHLSPGDWRDFTPSEWGRLKDHVIGIWKTFDEMAYDAQVLSLTANPLYTRSPEYKDYTDKLVQLSEQQIAHLKKEEAHLVELQSMDAIHQQTLDRFKSRNASLVLGEDREGNEIAMSQQIALLNSILIEIATIQTEQKVVEQRLLTQQKEARNLIMKMKQLEIEAQKGDVRNLNQLLELTRNP